MQYKLKLRDSSGKSLELLQDLPEKGSVFPTVIMVPGFGMDLHEYGYFDYVSRILTRHGIQTFRFSFEGLGNSEGSYQETTIDSQAMQLHDVVNYVNKDRFTKKKRIGILAQSFGTSVVTVALPLPKIKTVIYTSAPIDPYTSISKWFKRQQGFFPEGISKIERSDKRKTKIGPEFWTSLANHDLKREITVLKQPILFIHGGNDIRIKPFEAHEYFSQVKSRKKFVLIERADHGFTNKFRLKVIDQITKWFSEELF
ncbi:MAG: prolyl oligopeptidase family serine peptidase [Patescibacteria group bacterium]